LVTGLRNLPLIIGVMVAAVCVDILAVFLRPGPDSLARFRSFGGFAALLTWTIYIVTAYLTSAGVRVIDDNGGLASAKPELFIGVPIVQALVGVLLAALLIPSSAPTREPSRIAA
jgi:hypothetical protein